MIKKETFKVKHLILPYINENDKKIIDIGFGGDKIVSYADGCELPLPYGKYEGYHIDIKCDISKGIPIPNNTYDIVYSSHLIEDFENTNKILTEFIRILKINGKLILVFPDQVKYENCCRKNNEIPNQSHKISNMGINYMKNEIEKFNCERIFEQEHDDYNCILIYKLKGK